MKNKILCLIPARSGSKGIRYKNLAKLKGKPLLYWTIKIAKKIKYFDKIIVSTDSNKFQKYAIKNKVCAPFLRPKIISRGDTPMKDVMRHTLDYFKKNNYIPFAIAVLLPTSPMRKKSTLNKACRIFIKKKLDYIVTVEKIKHNYHPEFVFRNKNELIKSKIKNLQEKKIRQKINDLFGVDGGVISITKTKYVSKSLVGARLDYLIINRPESYDIDSVEDLKLCEKTKIKL